MNLRWEITVLQRPVRVFVRDTGGGLVVLVEGGDQGHVGAAAVAAPGEETRVIQLPGHREGDPSRFWAETLCAALGVPVSVTMGVHYDGLEREQIPVVVAALEDACREMAARLKNGKPETL